MKRQLIVSIYSYFDYRDFLRDNFAERKAHNQKYSYRAIADKIGINSATLIRILNGKRNLSRNILPKFLQFLKLKKKEATTIPH